MQIIRIIGLAMNIGCIEWTLSGIRIRAGKEHSIQILTSKNENPPKFSTKGDCHVYSWL